MRTWSGFVVLVSAISAIAIFGTRYGQSQAKPVPEQLSTVEFEKLLKAVRPVAGEDEFDKIPWLTSIWEARKVAAKEGKPILLWEMDGHPLGCG